MTDDLVKRLLSVSIYDPHEAEVLSEEAAYCLLYTSPSPRD